MPRSGFTLIELSIVLVIIGLVIGGVTVGQDLIRSAELNSLNSDVYKYRVAWETFKLKYDAIPGDMENASAYWPGQSDGNGNGYIIDPEVRHAWAHMSQSGIIPGAYVDAVANYNAGVDSPGTSISGSLWMLNSTVSTTPWGDSVSEELGISRNIMALVEENTLNTAFEDGTGEVLGVEEVSILDKKTDDGLAGSGNFRAASCNNEAASFFDMINDGTANICDVTMDCDYDLSSTALCQFFVTMD
jgi:prepilin-type N-terminal cleavage/methylation domain-containing protein